MTHENTATRTRRIIHRTAGQGHDGITRLMSPGDIGELVKPFVFLDHFQFDDPRGPGMAVHPHSGIATHSTLLEGAFTYADSTGKSGRLEPQSVEWMQAGGGVWHGGCAQEGKPVRGFQLWIALPPPLENAPAESHYVNASDVPCDGRVRLLLGTYDGLRSSIPYHVPLTYLHVRLKNGESWRYQPPTGHDVAWLAVSLGALNVAGTVLRREMAVFEAGNRGIDVVADGDTEFVLGSAVKHPHPLVLGYYSVHTSPDALAAGEAGIQRIAKSVSPAALSRQIAIEHERH